MTKVYGGSRMTGKGQMRVVFYGTRKALATALRMSTKTCRDWYVETGNEVEIKVAKARPGVLLHRPLNARTGFWLTDEEV